MSKLVAGRVAAEITLPVPAERAFEIVGSFANADWVPGTARCDVEGQGVGATRVITTADGARIKERLLAYEPAEHTYVYTIVEAPMPIRNYESRVRVWPTQGGCVVSWSATYEAPEELSLPIEQGMSGLYRAAMDGLSTRLARSD